MGTLYSIGYLAPEAMETLQARVDTGAILVDVRLVPASRFRPQWSRKRLQERFGDHYLHAKALGNAQYRDPGAGIKLLDPAHPTQGIPQVLRLLDERDVCLLCACTDYATCHVSKVVELLREARPALQFVRL